jgi:L-malate glycosyltransferase
MLRVLIIQSVMYRYRVPFYTGLYDALQRDGIDLRVAYSGPSGVHAGSKNIGELPRQYGIEVKGYWLWNRLLYQPVWKEIAGADLVIVTPEAKFLINPVLLLLSALRMKTVAFWGLGPNMYPHRSETAKWIKERCVTKVDWWFAYTATVAEYLQRCGMPHKKITNVQNATDARTLQRLMSEIPEEDVLRAKERLTGTREGLVGLYCGLIGEIKAIPLLLDAARAVRQGCPEFHLVLLGNGPDRPWLESAIEGEEWIHYLGSRYGRESALYYKMADVFLLAGSAGLAIVDSFAAGLPVLATDLPTHPPEISYVVDGENGFLSPHEASAFADSILHVLSDPALMERLRTGARESGFRYTMEAMVENFRGGIKDCLACYGVVRVASQSALTSRPQ